MDKKLIEEAYMEILLKESPDTPPIWRKSDSEENEKNHPSHVEKNWSDYDAVSFGSVLGIYFCAYSRELFSTDGFVMKSFIFRDNMTHYNMIKVLLSVFSFDINMDWSKLSWENVEKLIRERFKIRFDIIATSYVKPINVYSHIHSVILAHLDDEQRENLEKVNVDRTNFFEICGRLWTNPYMTTEDYIISFWNRQEMVDAHLGEIKELIRFYGMDPARTHVDCIDDDAKFVDDTKTLAQTGSTSDEPEKETKKRSEEEIEKALGAEHVMDPIEKRKRGIRVPEGVGSRKVGPDLKTRQMAMSSESRIPSFKEHYMLMEDTQTFTMYHGGSKWIGSPEIRPSKKGRYEHGVGIYFTTKWDTAKKYSGGSKIITIAQIDRNFTDIENIHIPLQEAIDFLKSISIRNRNDIIQNMRNHCQRTNKETISLSILNNLVVNYSAGSGNAGMEITRFMVSKGGDAAVVRQGGEDWLVVFNPDIIKSYRKLESKEKTVFDLPTIS